MWHAISHEGDVLTQHPNRIVARADAFAYTSIHSTDMHSLQAIVPGEILPVFSRIRLHHVCLSFVGCSVALAS